MSEVSLFQGHRAFRLFAEEVRSQSRYVPSSRSTEFLKAFLSMARSKLLQLSKETRLVRAQKGNDQRPLTDNGVQIDMVPSGFGPIRMKPLPDKAHEGRVNPKGIPCLYLSDDIATAIAETRSLVGDYVSVGYVNTLHDLTLVDFSEEATSRLVYWRDPPDDKIDALVWQEINTSFSTPVTRDDQIAEYAPTQILAEHLKVNSYDGIVYRSRLGPGRNIALFDLGAADMRLGELYQVKGVEYKFETTDGPYTVSHASKAGG